MFKIGLILTIIYSIIYNIVIASQGDYYGTYSTYNDICFKRNIFAFLPVIICVLVFLGCLFFTDFDKIAKSLILICITGFASCLNALHSSHKNINTGYQMDMTDTKRFDKEVKNELYGKASLIGNTLNSIHHTKKSIKELSDVDSWKEMK